MADRDIRLQTGFLDHPKTLRLERELVGFDAVKSLLRLWFFAADNRPKGILSGMDVEDIELAARWNGEVGIFVRTLLKLHFLEQLESGDYSLHDWIDHQAWLFYAPERSDQARKAADARWGNNAPRNAGRNAPRNAERNAPSPSPSPSPSPKHNEPSFVAEGVPSSNSASSNPEKSRGSSAGSGSKDKNNTRSLTDLKDSLPEKIKTFPNGGSHADITPSRERRAKGDLERIGGKCEGRSEGGDGAVMKFTSDAIFRKRLIEYYSNLPKGRSNEDIAAGVALRASKDLLINRSRELEPLGFDPELVSNSVRESFPYEALPDEDPARGDFMIREIVQRVAEAAALMMTREAAGDRS